MNYKKFGVYLFLAFMFIAPVVFAFGLKDPVTDPSWFKVIVDFFKLGNNWSQVISAFCIMAIIYAALYDILSFTAFESMWVKVTIAVAITLITAMSQMPLKVATWALEFAGAYTAIGVFAVVVIAVTFFVIASFFTSKLKLAMAKNKANNEEAKIKRNIGGIKGGVAVARALGTAAEEYS